MTKPRYPETRIDNAIEHRAGLEIPDPYRWLEGNGPEVRDWQRRQNALASDHVRAWPFFDALKEQVSHYLSERRASLPRLAGGTWFRTGQAEGASHGCIFAAGEPFSEGRVIFDPATVKGGDRPPFITWFAPSPCGKVLAVGLCSDGSENNNIWLIDVASGRTINPAPQQLLMDGWTGGVTWLPDSSGFFFLALEKDAHDFRKQILFHSMATGEQRIETLPWPGNGPFEYTAISISSDGKRAIANHGLLATSPIAIKDLTDQNARWTSFVPPSEHSVTGHGVGRRYVAVTTRGAGRGRVVAIPFDSPMPDDSANWIELVPETDAVQLFLTPVGDHFYLYELVDTYTRLRIFTLDGAYVQEVALPERGVISKPPFLVMTTLPSASSDEFFFAFSSFRRSWALYRHAPGMAEPELLFPSATELENIIVEDHWAPSADGKLVPYHCVRRRDTDPGKPQAALIAAYGGYNVPFLEQFPSGMAPFIDAGGLYVHAHIRGGSELGFDWWQGGRMANKQNCYKDVYAVAEHLIAGGRTSPDRLALSGGSNGGLMSGVALTQRPDLWKAVVPRVPILDLIGAMRDPYGHYVLDIEYGDPEDRGDVEAILDYSAYHLVRDGVTYPAVYIDAGDTDPRCPPWHARKFAARLQAAHGNDNPVLLHIWENSGHGGATDGQTRIEEYAECLSFIMMNLGMMISK